MVLCLAACSGGVVSLQAKTTSFEPKEYDTVYQKWTRDAEEFSLRSMRDLVHCTATFESAEFRAAYISRYAHDAMWSEREKETRLAEELRDTEEQHRFLVTLASPNFRESDLNNPRTMWRVVMVIPDARLRVAPVRIQNIGKPSAFDKVYFPSISPQRWTFRITFPARTAEGQPFVPPEANSVILRFSGPEDRVDLVWKLKS